MTSLPKLGVDLTIVGVSVSDYDRELARAVSHGIDVARAVGVTHFFSVTGFEPVSTRAALEREGIVDIVIDEELTGDGHWHIAAFTKVLLTQANMRQAQTTMEHIAQNTGVHYDGWQLTLNARNEQNRSK